MTLQYFFIFSVHWQFLPSVTFAFGYMKEMWVHSYNVNGGQRKRKVWGSRYIPHSVLTMSFPVCDTVVGLTACWQAGLAARVFMKTINRSKTLMWTWTHGEGHKFPQFSVLQTAKVLSVWAPPLMTYSFSYPPHNRFYTVLPC